MHFGWAQSLQRSQIPIYANDSYVFISIISSLDISVPNPHNLVISIYFYLFIQRNIKVNRLKQNVPSASPIWVNDITIHRIILSFSFSLYLYFFTLFQS